MARQRAVSVKRDAVSADYAGATDFMVYSPSSQSMHPNPRSWEQKYWHLANTLISYHHLTKRTCHTPVHLLESLCQPIKHAADSHDPACRMG